MNKLKKIKSPEKEKGKKWDGTSRPSSELYKENWNEIFGQKEQDRAGSRPIRAIL